MQRITSSFHPAVCSSGLIARNTLRAEVFQSHIALKEEISRSLSHNKISLSSRMVRREVFVSGKLFKGVANV